MQSLIAVGVGVRRRDRRAEPVQRQHGQREQQLLAQVGRPERRCECAEHKSSCDDGPVWSSSRPADSTAPAGPPEADSIGDGRPAQANSPRPAARRPRPRHRQSSVADPPAAAIFSRAVSENALRGDLELDAAQVPVAEHLDRLRPCGPRRPRPARRRRPCRPRGNSSASRADVDDLELDPEAVLEALELRQPHVDRQLAALEAGRHLVAGLGALGAATGGLALGRPHRDPRGSSWCARPGAGRRW